MEGIVLFADDQVFDTKSYEYKLFQKFKSEPEFPIIPIDNIGALKKAILSISTYKVLILDWNFKRESVGEDENVNEPDEDPLDLLKKNPIYSLVYVYSRNLISDEIKTELKELYPNKIYFEQKNGSRDVETEFKKIIEGIKQFKESNKHMSVPFIWSQTINKSVQEIFRELELADKNWINEIYNTAKEDGSNPNIEVINIFHNLLNDLIIQNKTLEKELSNYIQQNDDIIQNKEEELAKLYQRIYYTKLLEDTPFTTGDIFKFSEDEYGILFTPECDVNEKKEKALEFLVFSKNQFEDYLSEKKEYEKTNYSKLEEKGYKKDNEGKITKELKGELGELVKLFNNGNMNFHILPSFPFDKGYNKSAYISFETAFRVKLKHEYEEKRTKFKLNSPYIYQLRQRFFSYMGRVGVPAIPQNLKLFNLK